MTTTLSKILIIEDDPFVRRFYQRLFTFQKYEIFLAENGEIGLAKAVSWQPHLILLDIIMPVINGLTVLRKLKGNPQTAAIPVLMLTNVEEEETIKEAANLKADGFLVKAKFEPEKLIKKMKKYV